MNPFPSHQRAAHSGCQLILCETVSDIFWAAARIRSGVELIALTAEAADACITRDLHYSKLEDFYGPDELYQRRTLVFDRFAIWLDWIDAYVSSHVPECRNTGFRAATSISFMLQTLCNEIDAEGFILQRILQKLNPEDIWIRPPADPGGRSPFLIRRPLYSWLLAAVQPEFGFRLHSIEGRGMEAVSTGLPHPSLLRHLAGFAKGVFQRYPRIMPEMKLARMMGGSAYLRTLFRAVRSHEPVMVLGWSYDLDPLICLFRKNRIPVTWLPDMTPLEDQGTPSNPARRPWHHPAARARMRAALQEIWVSLISHEDFWAPIRSYFKGKEMFFESAMRYAFENMLPAAWEAYGWADGLFKKKKYRAVLTWEAGFGLLNGPVMQAAQAHKIPTFIYQHGSTSRIDSLILYPHLLHAGTMFLYGSGTVGNFEKTWRGPKPIPRLLPVGSARIDRLLKAMTPARIARIRRKYLRPKFKRLVLYVPSVFGTLGRAYGDLAGYPDVSYFEWQKEIMDLFRVFPETMLLYKNFRAANTPRNPIPEYLEQHVPNAVVVQNQLLWQLFWAADLIILDHAISALAEALIARKPMIVFDPTLHDPGSRNDAWRDQLRRRATLCDSPAEFLSSIRDALDISEWAPPALHEDFIRSYVTHKGDGRSAERALSAMLGQP